MDMDRPIRLIINKFRYDLFTLSSKMKYLTAKWVYVSIQLIGIVRYLLTSSHWSVNIFKHIRQKCRVSVSAKSAISASVVRVISSHLYLELLTRLPHVALASSYVKELFFIKSLNSLQWEKVCVSWAWRSEQRWHWSRSRSAWGIKTSVLFGLKKSHTFRTQTYFSY